MTRLRLAPFDEIKMSQQLDSVDNSVTELELVDHLGGFDKNLHNTKLEKINNFAKNKDKTIFLYVSNPLNDTVTKKYLNLIFRLVVHPGLKQFKDYNKHPDLHYKNFICSFNGSPHVSRKLLVAILEKFRWFNSNYCSKNFSYSSDIISGHVGDYVSAEQFAVFNKFFCNSEKFNQTVYTFGHVRYDHRTNIYNLETKLTESFLHIVSETMATSYYPFITEKFLYSVVTRGLFVAYAQPGWHEHLEKYYGFKKYTKLFDYQFDEIQNPVERLVCLMTMISKFSILSADDWRDLYLLEKDTIEYNYDHYFSQDYLKILKQHE